MLKEFNEANFSLIIKKITKDKRSNKVLLVSCRAVKGFKSGEYNYPAGCMVVITNDNLNETSDQKILSKIGVINNTVKYLIQERKNLSAVIFYAGGLASCDRIKEMVARRLPCSRSIIKFLLTCKCNCENKKKQKIISKFVSFNVGCGGREEMGKAASVIKCALGG